MNLLNLANAQKTSNLDQVWTSAGVLILFLVSTVGLGIQILFQDPSEAAYLLPPLAILDGLVIAHYFSKFLPASRKLFCENQEIAIAHARLFWLATIVPSVVAVIASMVIYHLYRLSAGGGL